LLSTAFINENLHPSLRSAVNVEQLAKRRIWEGMKWLSIGCVSCAFMAGSFAMVDITITREGRLIAKPGVNMR
jgi:hypothetical protein